MISNAFALLNANMDRDRCLGECLFPGVFTIRTRDTWTNTRTQAKKQITSTYNIELRMSHYLTYFFPPSPPTLSLSIANRERLEQGLHNYGWPVQHSSTGEETAKIAGKFAFSIKYATNPLVYISFQKFQNCSQVYFLEFTSRMTKELT